MNDLNGSGFVRILNDAGGQALSLSRELNGKTGKFFLCLGGTQTSDIADISAAGATPESRRLTPAIDAEALIDGRCYSRSSLPVSPRGIVSPVVITRACLKLIHMPIEVIDCGTFSPAKVAATVYGAEPAAAVSTGMAMSLSRVEHLFQAGQKAGAEASASYDYVVLAECVPGGTTTALAVLTALGWNVNGMLSSSTPVPQHDLRGRLVAEGLSNSGLSPEEFPRQPLRAIAAVGDPMQPFVSGFALAALKKVPVILAGGSQMLAVFALIDALSKVVGEGTRSQRLPVVATTKWVAFDPGARSAELASLLSAPYTASCPDFTRSVYPGLRAYEEGNVKEGVGAGAAMLLAYTVGGFSETELVRSIDRTYSELVTSKGAPLDAKLTAKA